jgi:DNA polymerase III alpha subunit
METKKSLNEFLETTLDCDDIVQMLLQGGSADGVITTDDEELELYNKHAEQILHKNSYINKPTSGISVDEYHREKTNTWFIPEKYKTIDLENYLVERCPTQHCIDRAMMELKMYEERNLTDILRLFIFLIDYFRENKVVWGVGRGSSVASYILYLIGVHKINSIEYNLDITEFLK